VTSLFTVVQRIRHVHRMAAGESSR
jgi:hypothetical protein